LKPVSCLFHNKSRASPGVCLDFSFNQWLEFLPGLGVGACGQSSAKYGGK
jgi:hypothetical protein